MDLLLAIIPVALLAIGFSLYCLNLVRTEGVANLSPLVWAIVILVSQPAGGIAFLILGRRRQ